MSKSAPKAPDFAGAAAEQAQSSKEVTNQQTWANRPTQNTPWGTSTWNPSAAVDPATGQSVTRWEQNVSLSPQQQEALDSQMAVQRGRSGLAESMLTRMNNEYSPLVNWDNMSPGAEAIQAPDLQNSVDFSGAPALPDVAGTRQRAEDAIYGRAKSRLDPRFEQEELDFRNRLYAQGLREGDRAFDREVQNFGRNKTDAYQTAMKESIMGGGAEAARDFGMGMNARQQAINEIMSGANFGNTSMLQEVGGQAQAGGFNQQLRQQDIAEEMQRRGFSLNEINAILTGQQVGMPGMPNFSNANASQGIQSLAAAQMTGQANLDAFNAEQAALQGMLSGAGGLATKFIGG